MESKLTGVDGFAKDLHVRRSQEMEIEIILFFIELILQKCPSLVNFSQMFEFDGI